MEPIIKCYTCSRFKIVKVGRTDVALDCGFASMGYYDKGEGYFHKGCPEYDRDTEDLN